MLLAPALLAATLAHADPVAIDAVADAPVPTDADEPPTQALLVLHVDPGAGRALPDAPWSAELTAKLDVPVLLLLMTRVPAMLSFFVGGPATVDDVFAEVPPLSPQYELFGAWQFGAPTGEPWSVGGGLGLRLRPLYPNERLSAAARGFWIDADARYGTRGWGMDAAVGLDLPVGSALTVGPELTFVWEGGESRFVASLSFSTPMTVKKPLAIGTPFTLP